MKITRSFAIVFLGMLIFLGIFVIIHYKDIGFYHGAPVYTYKILKEFPHDRTAYTQGLVYLNGLLYEGTGRTLQRRSMLGKVQLETGEVLQKIELPIRYFGEGITIFGQNIFQLTYRANKGFIYDKDTLEQLKAFSYPTDGWGLTHDGENLIMSDGSSSLYFLDPKSIEKQRQVKVFDSVGFVDRLNELEYIDGKIYANIIPTNRIAIIDPENGRVTGWIDLNGALSLLERLRGVNVLNGIAYDPNGERLFITGKYWPKLFQIKLISSNENKFEYIVRIILNDCRMTFQNAFLFIVKKIKSIAKIIIENISVRAGNL
jgi:glutamine cyclotransferase